MKLYTFIYGDGVSDPIRIEEELPFASFNQAVSHAKRTLIDVLKQDGEKADRDSVFALVDGGDKLLTRVMFVDAAREIAESWS